MSLRLFFFAVYVCARTHHVLVHIAIIVQLSFLTLALFDCIYYLLLISNIHL